MIEPYRFTHPRTLPVHREIRYACAVFSGLRRTCLATAITVISDIALRSSGILWNASRSPLRLFRKSRELILPSDRCFWLISTDCPDWTDSHDLAFSFRLRLTPDRYDWWTDWCLCSDGIPDSFIVFPFLCVTLQCTKPSYTSPCTDHWWSLLNLGVFVSCKNVSMTEPPW